MNKQQSVNTHWLAGVGTLYLIAAILLTGPLLMLMLAGLVYLYQQSWLLISSVLWLLATLLILGGFYLYLRFLPTHKRNESEDFTRTNQPSGNVSSEADAKVPASNPGEQQLLPQRLKPKAYWSGQELQIWQTGLVQIEAALQTKPEWQLLPDLTLLLLGDTTQAYQCMREGQDMPDWKTGQLSQRTETINLEQLASQMKFSLPELLLVVSIACARYRDILLKYLPFADDLTIARASGLYRQQGRVRTGARWFNNIRRTLRVANPVSAVVGELRELLTQQVLSHTSDKLQTDLKRLLLQELLQVAMDLNSGRLKHTEIELTDHLHATNDSQWSLQALESHPLRILLLGQQNSGKSSLIHAIAEELQADLTSVPDANQSVEHEMLVESSLKLTFIDTPALCNTTEHQSVLSSAALEADLILHVVKATQPARALDASAVETLTGLFNKQPLRKSPPTIVVLTHCDQLSPKAHWEPPYDLGENTPKGASIKQALESTLNQLAYDSATVSAIPCCLSESRGQYNIDAVITQLLMQESDARATQLNRYRQTLSDTDTQWAERWQQMIRLGRVMGRAIVP